MIKLRLFAAAGRELMQWAYFEKVIRYLAVKRGADPDAILSSLWKLAIKNKLDLSDYLFKKDIAMAVFGNRHWIGSRRLAMESGNLPKYYHDHLVLENKIRY